LVQFAEIVDESPVAWVLCREPTPDVLELSLVDRALDLLGERLVLGTFACSEEGSPLFDALLDLRSHPRLVDSCFQRLQWLAEVFGCLYKSIKLKLLDYQTTFFLE
jgi:hypothetical protein